MSNQVAKTNLPNLEAILLQGDLASLDERGRVEYHTKLCQSLNLNPLTRPFEYIRMNGKLVLYAKRDACEQLRKNYEISVTITAREKIEDVYRVTAKASLPGGRFDESDGAVAIGGLKGENLANALMKAETKAKRRVTLSICGLGMLDENEVPANAAPVQARVVTIPDKKIETKSVKDIAAVGKELAAKAALEDAKAKDKMPWDSMATEVIPHGKFKGKKFGEVDKQELFNYSVEIQEKKEQLPPKLKEEAVKLLPMIDAYLGESEK